MKKVYLLMLVVLVFGLTLPCKADNSFLDLGNKMIMVKGKISINGRDARQFSSNDEQVINFAFSPDSQSIAYFSLNQGTKEISLRVATIQPVKPILLAKWSSKNGIPGKEIVWSPLNHAFCYKVVVNEYFSQTLLAAVPFKLIKPIDHEGYWEEMIWSPDGQRIVYRVNRKVLETDIKSEPTDEIGVFDLETKSAKTLFSVEKFQRFLGWSDRRTLILLHQNKLKGSNNELVLVNLNKPNEAVVSPVPNWYPPELYSFDRHWRIDPDNAAKGIEITSTDPTKTEQRFTLINDPKATPLGWSPKDLILAYYCEDEGKATPGLVPPKNRNLFLASIPKPNNFNQTLLIAQNIDQDQDKTGPSWSPDGQKIAYISERKLWVIFLEYR